MTSGMLSASIALCLAAGGTAIGGVWSFYHLHWAFSLYCAAACIALCGLYHCLHGAGGEWKRWMEED